MGFKAYGVWAGAVCFWVALTSAVAAESPTLERIRQSGVINLGHRVTQAPFSFFGDDHQLTGYGHELSLVVVEGMKERLKMPHLKVNLVELSITNRFMLVESGQVDLECGSTTHTVAREKRVGFSTSYFALSAKLLVRKNSGIHGLADMAGKHVSVASGGTSELFLRSYIEKTGLDIRILPSSANDESFSALKTGRTQAHLHDDAVLYANVANAPDPSEWVVLPTSYTSEVLACTMSKDDAEFKALVDGILTRYLKSPNGLAHYRRWFQRPMPGRGVNLNMPLTPAMRALLKEPNDRVPE